MTISAVLPLKTKGRHYAENIARCDILFSSLRHFSDPALFDKILVVVPHDEFEDAQRYARAWSDFPVVVIDESVHFAAFAEFSAPHQVRPWHRQQIIKLGAANLVDTEYFLVLDPDVFALRRFDEAMLLPGGPALTHYQSRAREGRYWVASGALLGQEPHLERDALWWTPTLLSATLCRSLHRRIEELHDGENWMRVLLARYMVDWTEYTLYWLNAEREGLLDTYHARPAPGAPELHADESVWHAAGADGLAAWDAETHMGETGTGLFAVIQSNTRIPPAVVAAKLSPYMKIDLQPFDRHHSLRLRIVELYSAVVRRVLKRLRR